MIALVPVSRIAATEVLDIRTCRLVPELVPEARPLRATLRAPEAARNPLDYHALTAGAAFRLGADKDLAVPCPFNLSDSCL